jgi:2-keto-4-pentenoate hydratase/2-oxohepta-3-ene-1,7-dioic acid hydratase in catechol pathway
LVLYLLLDLWRAEQKKGEIMIRTRFGIILREPTASDSDIAKKKWVKKYSHRLIRLWLRQQTPFCVARAYAEHIKECLTEFYEDPLKRTFIETTYH